MFYRVDRPRKDHGRMAEVFCVFLAHFPWNWLVGFAGSVTVNIYRH